MFKGCLPEHLISISQGKTQLSTVVCWVFFKLMFWPLQDDLFLKPNGEGGVQIYYRVITSYVFRGPRSSISGRRKTKEIQIQREMEEVGGEQNL